MGSTAEVGVNERVICVGDAARNVEYDVSVLHERVVEAGIGRRRMRE